MRIWIDVESPSGSRLGVILTATGWTYTPRYDLAGEFSFRMPAADTAATLLQPKRVVRCWANVNGVDTELGSGVVDSIQLVAGVPAMLEVRGDNILRELTYRSVGDLALMDAEAGHPISCRDVVAAPASDTAMPNAIDGDPATFNTITLAFTTQPNQWLYLSKAKTFTSATFVLGAAVNNNDGELGGQYYNEESGDWEAIEITEDTTKVGAAPLAQSGTVTWKPPPGWGPTAPGTDYEIRLYAKTVTFDAVDICDVTVTTWEPTADALSMVMAYAPAGWALDAINGHTATGSSVYLQMAGESVLTALCRIAEQTGEHFILSYSGRRVLWLGKDKPTTGVRAVQPVDMVAGLDNPHICYITDLSERRDAYELISRIYPHGGGTGSARPTLANISAAKELEIIAAGYTVNKTDNYIDYAAAETYYGLRIEQDLSWSDINAKDTTAAQKVNASDALADRAMEYMQRHSAASIADVPRFYRLGVTKLDMALWPGHTIRVVYRQVVDGYTAVSIDDDLLILESTLHIDTGGVRTIALQVATVDRWPETDASAVVGGIAAASTNAAHETPQAGLNTSAMGLVVQLAVEDGLVTTIRRVGKQSEISQPSGGATNDAQAREAINSILALLRTFEMMA